MAMVRTTITEVRDLLARLTKPVSAESRKKLAPKTLTLNPRPIRDSHARATIPIKSHKDLDFRMNYVNHENNVRLGRLLEDLDLFAGWIAYRHNSDQEYKDGTSPLSIVTACVDSVEIYKPTIQANQDLYMFGFVSWTGSSSMEITMHLTLDANWKIEDIFDDSKFDDTILHSKFVMVARDHSAEGSAAKVYPLEVNTEVEKRLNDLGFKNKNSRIASRKADLIFKPPTENEAKKIHARYIANLDKDSGSFTHLRASSKQAPYILMKETSLKSCILCQPEYRNVHNKIFGGFLMRQAIELGEANFSLSFHESVPHCIEVADISFKAPVEIGSLLLLNSKIVYTRNRMAVLRVHAQVVKNNTEDNSRASTSSESQERTSVFDSELQTKKSQYAVTRMTNTTTTTNVFYFVFESRLNDALPQIMPETYGESLLYIDGERCLNKMLDRHASSYSINSHVAS